MYAPVAKELARQRAATSIVLKDLTDVVEQVGLDNCDLDISQRFLQLFREPDFRQHYLKLAAAASPSQQKPYVSSVVLDYKGWKVFFRPKEPPAGSTAAPSKIRSLSAGFEF